MSGVDQHILESSMKGKRILITGAAGSIGSELCRQLVKNNKVYGLDNNESGLADIMRELGFPARVGDIRDEATLRDVFDDFRPHIVYHAAALKHVDMVEYAPIEAIKTNILGTYNVLQLSKIYEVEKFVFISTDKVVNAQSIMGNTKKTGEVMTVNQGYVAVRFANVLGSRGSVIPLWERQINQGGPVTVTDDRMERYMMTIEEAVALVIEAGNASPGGETWVMDMGEPIRILDLAKEIVRLSGRKIKIQQTGLRPGETLGERLMTVEEEARATKHGKFFIIKRI